MRSRRVFSIQNHLLAKSKEAAPGTGGDRSTTRGKLVASDLPVALYLNQRVTFDLLAALEGGFAHLTAVQQSSSNTKSAGLQGEAGLGISNVFALLGITLGAKASRETSSTSSGTTTEELIHTPTSLFARLRKELVENGLVKTVESTGVGLDAVGPGDFVEFEAVLRPSPLISVLRAFQELMPIVEGLSPPPATVASQGKGRQPAAKRPSEMQAIARQIDAVLQAVTAEGSKDLVADCGALRFVLAVEEAYFVDPSMNDVIDGTFRVFGKVTRVVPAADEAGISLLRKTALGNFGEIVEKLGEAFALLQNSGFTGPTVETRIPGPSLQVIPIGIFA